MFRVCLYVFALTFLYKLESCTSQEEIPLVLVKQGQIQGIAERSMNGKEFYSYMSIPYAEPPVGELRFKDPVQKGQWDGILNGTVMPASCLQSAFFPTDFEEGKQVTLNGREDCLFLNVFTAATKKKENKLPVMVFIHGGGFFSGAAAFHSPYVLMNEDIVLVVIQYRLGILGFLSTEDDVMPGNMGLKDQQLALKWVKENIDAFGGDTNLITIFGESAGAASVHYHILSPGSKGLFNRAILESATSLCPWASNKDHLTFAIETGKEFNCSIDLGTESYLHCMQNVHPYYLTIAAAKTNILGLSPNFVLPRVDGVFITEPPEVLMKKGQYNKVDIIAGINRDEGGLALVYDFRDPKREENIKKHFETLGPISLFFHEEDLAMELTNLVYKFYLKRDDVTYTDKDWREILDMNSDRMFKVCHDIVANLFAADPDIKLYLYQFDYFGQVFNTRNISTLDGRNVISHGDELVYLFYDGKSSSWKLVNEDDLKMREIFVDLWTNFAKTGNATASNHDFLWKEATPQNFQHLSLTPSPVMINDNFKEKRKFWASLNTTQNMLLRNIDSYIENI